MYHYTSNINENCRKVCLFKMFVGYNKSKNKGTAGTTCTDVQLLVQRFLRAQRTKFTYKLLIYIIQRTINIV